MKANELIGISTLLERRVADCDKEARGLEVLEMLLTINAEDKTVTKMALSQAEKCGMEAEHVLDHIEALESALKKLKAEAQELKEKYDSKSEKYYEQMIKLK